jgi:hypothetical protein
VQHGASLDPTDLRWRQASRAGDSHLAQAGADPDVTQLTAYLDEHPPQSSPGFVDGSLSRCHSRIMSRTAWLLLHSEFSPDD